jgi:hypothetical protein
MECHILKRWYLIHPPRLSNPDSRRSHIQVLHPSNTNHFEPSFHVLPVRYTHENRGFSMIDALVRGAANHLRGHNPTSCHRDTLIGILVSPRSTCSYQLIPFTLETVILRLAIEETSIARSVTNSIMMIARDPRTPTINSRSPRIPTCLAHEKSGRNTFTFPSRFNVEPSSSPAGSKSRSCRVVELVKSLEAIASLQHPVCCLCLLFDSNFLSFPHLELSRLDSHWLLLSHTVSRVVISGRHFCCKSTLYKSPLLMNLGSGRG